MLRRGRQESLSLKSTNVYQRWTLTLLLHFALSLTQNPSVCRWTLTVRQAAKGIIVRKKLDLCYYSEFQCHKSEFQTLKQ